MMYFGRKYNAPIYAECARAGTPVGYKCAHCAEEIIDGDDGWLIPDYLKRYAPFHAECHLRRVVGSVAHQKKQCSCYKAAQLADNSMACEEAGNKRRAARAAETYFYTRVD